MYNSKKEEKEELFFPYYINQGRLLDLYAILNNGYSQYSEITTAINKENKEHDKAEINPSFGFKLIQFGASIEGESEKSNGTVSENKEKKVHTITSILSIVKHQLSEKGYLSDINNAKPGSFICVDVSLSINSINKMIEEVDDIVKLLESIKKIDSSINVPDKSMIKDLKNVVKVLFCGQEVVFQDDKFAILSSVSKSNLYQASMNDIINTELKCLAQVKRVYPNGTELMKNTIFSKLKDKKSKDAFIDKMSSFVEQEFFDFDVVVVPSIEGKPVYQVEIIAMYQ